MSWRGYEPTRHIEMPESICRVVLDLYEMRRGAAGVTIRLGESDGTLPESPEEREALADALRRELSLALDELLLS